MRRSIVVVSLVTIALAVRWRHHPAPENKAGLVVTIVKDVAQTDGHGISWRFYENGAGATLWQNNGADVRGGLHKVLVETDSWELELSPSKVFHVTCYVTGGEHGYPEYGFISFQPENGDVFNALFSVGFDGTRIDALERVCAKHGIPVER
jgi:hypothetical protein